jgi:hypothetical protein
VLRRIFPNEFIVITALFVAAASFVSFGCDEKPSWKEPGPEATFETFLMDWYRGEDEAAFASIAPDDRQRLTEPLEELEGKLDSEDLPEKVDMLVVGRVDNPYDIKDVKLEGELQSAPKEGQEVTLAITYHDGREGEARLVWGGERWFVDLPVAAETTESNGSDSAAEKEPDPAPSKSASDDAGSDSEAGSDSGDASNDSAAVDDGSSNLNERSHE